MVSGCFAGKLGKSNNMGARQDFQILLDQRQLREEIQTTTQPTEQNQVGSGVKSNHHEEEDFFGDRRRRSRPVKQQKRRQFFMQPAR